MTDGGLRVRRLLSPPICVQQTCKDNNFCNTIDHASAFVCVLHSYSSRTFKTMLFCFHNVCTCAAGRTSTVCVCVIVFMCTRLTCRSEAYICCMLSNTKESPCSTGVIFWADADIQVNIASSQHYFLCSCLFGFLFFLCPPLWQGNNNAASYNIIHFRNFQYNLTSHEYDFLFLNDASKAILA